MWLGPLSNDPIDLNTGRTIAQVPNDNDEHRRIVLVVMGSEDGSDGVWLDDGSRLVFGNYEIVNRPIYYGPAHQEVVIRISGVSVLLKGRQ